MGRTLPPPQTSTAELPADTKLRDEGTRPLQARSSAWVNMPPWEKYIKTTSKHKLSNATVRIIINTIVNFPLLSKTQLNSSKTFCTLDIIQNTAISVVDDSALVIYAHNLIYNKLSNATVRIIINTTVNSPLLNKTQLNSSKTSRTLDIILNTVISVVDDSALVIYAHNLIYPVNHNLTNLVGKKCTPFNIHNRSPISPSCITSTLAPIIKTYALNIIKPITLPSVETSCAHVIYAYNLLLDLPDQVHLQDPGSFSAPSEPVNSSGSILTIVHP